MSIHFTFHPEKALEAAALFLKLHGKPMKHLGLLKLLYLADRTALDRMGQSITGDHYVSMNYGPVLSGVYDLIKGTHGDADALALWSQFVSARTNYLVSLRDDPGDDDLCEEEECIIREVYARHGSTDPFSLAELTHDLPEWKDPRGSSIPILIGDLLRHLGKSDAEILEITREAARESYLDQLADD